MAGDWLPMRLDLHDDPAVIQVAAAVGLDEHGVVGRLLRLWAWANQQLRDGDARGVTLEWVDRHIGVTGFAAALVSAGWLVTTKAGVSFPNFDRWNSQGAKKRLLASRRMKRSRDAKRDAPSATEASPEKEERESKKKTPSESRDAPKPRKPRATADSPHGRCVAFFCNAWEGRYGSKYPFNGGKDGDAVRWVLGQVGGDEDRFQLVTARFLADADPFVIDKRHPLGFLRSQLAKWLVDALPGTGPPNPKFRTRTDELLDLTMGPDPDDDPPEDRPC